MRGSERTLVRGVSTCQVPAQPYVQGSSNRKGIAAQGRIAADRFPDDWKHYTLTFPVVRYRHFSCAEIAAEMETCGRTFYSLWNTVRRAGGSLWRRRKPLIALVANLSYRSNLRQSRKNGRDFLAVRRHVAGDDRRPRPSSEPPRVPYVACATPQSSMADV